VSPNPPPPHTNWGFAVHIHAVDVVLFLHIAVAVFTFGIAGLLLTGLVQMRRAESVAVLRSWERLTHRIEPWFPILVVFLIALGAWLISLSHKEFSWSDGWVLTAVVTLVIMEAYGGVVLAPNGKRLHTMVEAAPEGPVPDEIRSAVMNPLVWAGAWGEMGLAAGVLFLMPTKPSGAWAVVIVAVVGLVTVGTGYRLSMSTVNARLAESRAVA
jgi:hypothetical protein